MTPKRCRRGRCRRCGQCCHQGNLWSVATEEERALATRYSRGLVAAHVERNEPCVNLRLDGGQATCAVHRRRPWYCRVYPQEPAHLLPGCGYSFS